MLSVMLFEDSMAEEKKKETVEDATVVGKASLGLVLCFPVCFAILIAAGVLLLVFRPIPQYFASAICLFAASIAPLFFFIDALTFRLSIGKGKISVRRITSKETVYAYTDVSWQMQSPDKKRSAILVFSKGLPIARILPGAKNYKAVTSLRHKGTLKEGEKAILRSLEQKK